uniref:peptidylprolyl isomerase n=1 Tax=Ditylum brightwellii TaxID=49249 RepID=A0A7S2E706_9STRA
MRLSLILAATLASSASAYSDFKVEITNGITECADSDKIKTRDFVRVHYILKIDESSIVGEPGEFVGSSHMKGEPMEMQAGVGQWIEGWDKGIVGLCVGAKATIIIPPDLGYGDKDLPKVPAGSTLNFAVEVLDIMDKPPPPPNMFDTIDVNKDRMISRRELESFFANMKQQVPAGIFEGDDKNSDGFISFDEFSGPKGLPREEL